MLFGMKTSLTLPLVSFLLLGSLSQVSSQQPATRPAKTQQPQAQTLHLHWPIPAKATVTEKILKRGRNAVTTYTFELVPNPKNNARWIGRLSNIQVKQMETGNATKEQVALSKKVLTAISSALPTLSINPKTWEATAEGVEEGINAVLKILQENTKSDKDRDYLRLIAKNLKSKAMMQSLKEASLSFWNAWAGSWHGLKLPAEGSSSHFDGTMYFPMGGEGTCKVTVTNLGSPKGRPDLIQLKFHQASDSSAIKSMVENMKKNIPPQYRAQVRADVFESVQVQSTVTATLDRKTLLPHHVLVEKTAKVKVKGRPSRTVVERHDYSFDWKN